MSLSELTSRSDIQVLVTALREELERGKLRALAAIERERKETYWRVGQLIRLHLQAVGERADYGTGLFAFLAKNLELNKDLLYRSCRFYDQYPDGIEGLRGLSWSHVQGLLTVADKKERQGYEQDIVSQKMSAREFKALLQTRRPALPETALDVESQLSVKREEPYVYRSVSKNGQRWVDLGFNFFVHTPKGWDIVEDKVTHYTYKATVIEIVDGDTLWLDIDLGFNMRTEQKVRLRGVDAPEKESPTGILASNFLQKRLLALPFIVVKTYWKDKYARYLVDIFYGEPEDDFLEVASQGAFLNQELLVEGLAVVI